MKFMIFFYILSCGFSVASDEEGSLNLSQFSHYSDETVKKANEAFLAIEEGEFSEALSPLKYAAEKRERYSMPKYAYHLMHKDQLTKSEKPLDDLRQAANLMLMAAFRHEDMAEEFVTEISETAKLINKKGEEPGQGPLDIIKTISSECREKWLSGTEIGIELNSKKKLDYSIKLFVFSALPYTDIDHSIVVSILHENCDSDFDEYLIKRLYAYHLMHKDQLTKSEKPLDDLRQAANLMLMAAYRGEKVAKEFMYQVDETAKLINKKGEEPGQGPLDIIKTISSEFREKWLSGTEIGIESNSKKKLEDAQDLFVFSVLQFLDLDCDELAGRIKEHHSGRFGTEPITGISPKALDDHATGLGITTHIYHDYPGDKKADVAHKLVYGVDSGMHFLEIAGLPVKKGKRFKRFIHGERAAMAAGPVYDGVRKIKKKGTSPSTSVGASDGKSAVPQNKAFFFNSYYKRAEEFCREQRRVLWFVEATHMDEPWKVVDRFVRDKFAGIWPGEHSGGDTKDPKVREDRRRVKEINDLYKQEIDKFVKSEDFKKSLLLRFYLLATLEEVNGYKEDPTVTLEEKKQKKASSKKNIGKKVLEDAPPASDAVVEDGAKKKKRVKKKKEPKASFEVRGEDATNPSVHQSSGKKEGHASKKRHRKKEKESAMEDAPPASDAVVEDGAKKKKRVKKA